jgi:hypothetical protein
MILRFFVNSILLVPFGLFGQTPAILFDAKLDKEIYSIIQIVIKKEKLSRKYGLQINPGLHFNISNEDSSYLVTLLKPEVIDTTNKSDSVGFGFGSDFTWPNRNVFTRDDIEYILQTKHFFTDFKWDNSKLGFDLSNRKKRYTFSVPYFNLRHDKVIVMYEFLCPGLCGGGQTLLLSKTDKGWDITGLELWYH